VDPRPSRRPAGAFGEDRDVAYTQIGAHKGIATAKPMRRPDAPTRIRMAMSLTVQMTEQRRRLLSEISIFDLRRRIASLRSANLKTLSAEAAAYRIGRVIDQYPFQIRSMELNGVYRARPNKPGEVFSSAAQLWYPPATAVVRPSRLNGIGQLLWLKRAEHGTSGIAATAWKCLYSSLGRDTRRKG
jgi:hypothetical protein